ncbi:(Fe-S)-binding protein [Brevibacillus sp. SYP-B805]|uniref:heterodisulfide reductase-related iron-sulfur binding cluster n=1 Tax=Brevibacillus sp. SYP-B805 TaxID=1578199 RepID=UPI0013EB9A8E|nr:(Fe-S)-binding protein [Brevibacillus sp. SYP-B805]
MSAPATKSHYLWEDPPDEEKYSACVHCGLCLESCPTYLETGHEQQSPRGRVHLIKAVAEGKIPLSPGFEQPVFTCLDCRACETACPSGVQVGSLIEAARGQIRKAMPLTGWRALLHAVFLRGVFPHPSRLFALGKLMKLYQRSGLQALARKTGLLNLLPGHLQAMERVVPAVPDPVMKRYPEVIPAQGTPRGRVALLTGCVMDVLFGDINEATVRVLTRNGYEVVVPRDQRCCGALHIHAGDREQGKILARRNIDAFLHARVDSVIVNAAGCGCALKEYPELLQNDPAYREKAVQFAEKVADISKFLAAHGYEKPTGRVEARVAYHDACHLAHGQGIRAEPRQLLREIPGVAWVEMPLADRCCGSAGIYNLTHPEMAGKILDEKMKAVPEQADIIAMGNPGCMLQMMMGVHRHGRTQRVVHTVQLLDWAYQREAAPQEERGM